VSVRIELTTQILVFSIELPRVASFWESIPMLW